MKANLVALCENYVKLNIEVDPGGLVQEILNNFLSLSDWTFLPNLVNHSQALLF